MKYYIRIENEKELIEIAETSFKTIYIESITYNLINKLCNKEIPFIIVDQKNKKYDIEEWLDSINDYKKLT